MSNEGESIAGFHKAFLEFTKDSTKQKRKKNAVGARVREKRHMATVDELPGTVYEFPARFRCSYIMAAPHITGHPPHRALYLTFVYIDWPEQMLIYGNV